MEIETHARNLQPARNVGFWQYIRLFVYLATCWRRFPLASQLVQTLINEDALAGKSNGTPAKISRMANANTLIYEILFILPDMWEGGQGCDHVERRQKFDT